MGNIDDRDVVFAQFFDLFKKAVDFFVGKRRRRLVHNDQLRIKKQCTRDLNHLLLSDAQSLNLHIRTQIQSHQIQMLLRKFRHFLFAKEQTLLLLHTKVKIFSDGHVLSKADLLMDKIDPVFSGLKGAGDLYLLAINIDLS